MRFEKQCLECQKAEDILRELMDRIDEQDEDAILMWKSLCEKAVRYANIRAKWFSMEKEERLDNDDFRTSIHDSFIVSINILARYQGNPNWRVSLGDDRKVIGDFACYLALHLALESR